MVSVLERREGRRGRWARCVHWVAEARSHRVILLVAAIWLLNGFDLALTLLSHQQGLLDEQNPFAKSMLERGVASVVLFKIGLVMVGSYPLLRFRTVRITELGTLVIVLMYSTPSINHLNLISRMSVSSALLIFASIFGFMQYSP